MSEVATSPRTLSTANRASFEQSTVSDVIRLAEARTGGYRNRARFLYETDSVGCVLDAILTQDNCKCLFIKGINNDQLIGAVSLSDIITYILDD
ncbi:unnamed protein product, partial [Anisakis simplex]|uniref:CBS domain-containing protein n=1 Tax=Anisakis simplex TaxID=6269 RepID=A0A0M3JQL8_ANISI